MALCDDDVGNGGTVEMKLTKRGEYVLKGAVIIGILGALFGIYEVIGHLWWVGDGYCWGSMLECMEGGL